METLESVTLRKYRFRSGCAVKSLLVLTVAILFILYFSGIATTNSNFRHFNEIKNHVQKVFIDQGNNPSDDVSKHGRENFNDTGFNIDIKSLCLTCRHKIKLTDQNLSTSETSKYQTCVTNSASDYRKGHSGFWSGSNQYIRHTHHSYLTSESLILDVGGNVGEDAKVFIDKFNPRKYVMLEPLMHLYKRLVKKFENNKNVIIYNTGVGIKNDNVTVKITGNDGDATSQFTESGSTGMKSVLHILNATEFLIRLGVGCFDFDLVTVNCEGCEFEFLEALLSTNLVRFFKNIQFATHPTLKYLKNPMQRYCKIQEILSRTHELSYQYKFNWENWRRKINPEQ